MTEPKETDVVEAPVLAIDKGPSGNVLSISVAEANPDGSFKYTHFFEGKNAEFVASLTSEITALRERVVELEGDLKETRYTVMGLNSEIDAFVEHAMLGKAEWFAEKNFPVQYKALKTKKPRI